MTVTLEPVIEVAEELLGVTELGVADDSEASRLSIWVSSSIEVPRGTLLNLGWIVAPLAKVDY